MWPSVIAIALMAQDRTPERALVRTNVPLVVTPVTVTDAVGKHVAGLAKEDFVLWDGSARRPAFDVELLEERVSLAVVVQANSGAPAVIDKMRRMGALVSALIAGEGGELLMVAYDGEVRAADEWLTEAEAISRAFTGLKGRGDRARQLDAVKAAVERLGERPRERRKVLIVVGESKDRGSEAKLGEVLKAAQRANVTIFAATYSPTATQFTAKAGVVPVSGKDSAVGGVNPLAFLGELGRLGKEDSAAALAKETGGRKDGFLRVRGLEELLAAIGEEIHRQYLIAFQPAEGEAGEEYRTIRVEIPGRPELGVRARPGYWYIR